MNFILHFPGTSFILLVTLITSFFQDQDTLERFLFIPKRVKKYNEWYRFLTSSLIHADFIHLFFNMLTFFFFAPVVENNLGHLPFVGLYLCSQIVSHIPTYLKNQNKDYASLGASGAVSGVVFSLIVYHPWIKIYLFLFPMPAILYAILYIAYSHYAAKNANDIINHSAHLWGALAGFFYTIIIDPNALPHFIYQLFG